MTDFILDSKSNLIFSDRVTSVQGILSDHAPLVSIFLGRELVFALLPNDEISLELYIILMASKCIPLFMPADISEDALARLVSEFRPSKIISVSCLTKVHPNYDHIYASFKYNVFDAFEKYSHTFDNNLFLLATTSGSTGSPKLIPQTFKNVFENTMQIAEAVGLRSGDVALASLPLSYTFGMSVVNCQLLKHGAVVASNFNILAKATLNSIIEHSVNIIAGVPTHFEQLLSARFFKSRYAEGIQKYLQAGGALKPDSYNLILGYQDQIKFAFYCMYGQAEATTRISISTPKDFKKFPGTVGKTLKKMNVQIKPIPGFTKNNKIIGEICCTGPNVCPDYINKISDLISLRNLPSNTLRTGDLGYFDPYGNLFISGRIKRFAKIRGISYNLEDIENKMRDETKVLIPCIDCEGKLYLFCPLEQTVDLCQKLEEILKTIGIKDYLMKFSHTTPLLSSGKIHYHKLLKSINSENYFL